MKTRTLCTSPSSERSSSKFLQMRKNPRQMNKIKRTLGNRSASSRRIRGQILELEASCACFHCTISQSTEAITSIKWSSRVSKTNKTSLWRSRPSTWRHAWCPISTWMRGKTCSLTTTCEPAVFNSNFSPNSQLHQSWPFSSYNLWPSSICSTSGVRVPLMALSPTSTASST